MGAFNIIPAQARIQDTPRRAELPVTLAKAGLSGNDDRVRYFSQINRYLFRNYF